MNIDPSVHSGSLSIDCSLSSFNSKMTSVESWSLSSPLAKRLHVLNHSNYKIIGPISARIAGVVVMPFALIVDTLGHLLLFSGKAFVAIPIGIPVNLIALTFQKSNWAMSQDFELSSLVIHLLLVTEHATKILLLPLVCVFNPDRAYHMTAQRAFHSPTMSKPEATNENSSIPAVPEMPASPPPPPPPLPGSSPKKTYRSPSEKNLNKLPTELFNAVPVMNSKDNSISKGQNAQKLVNPNLIDELIKRRTTGLKPTNNPHPSEKEASKLPIDPPTPKAQHLNAIRGFKSQSLKPYQARLLKPENEKEKSILEKSFEKIRLAHNPNKIDDDISNDKEWE